MSFKNPPDDCSAATSIPKVAVLTVNLNMADGLSGTIASVKSQTFRNFEFGVVDGGSSDDSYRIIQQNADTIDWHVSEKDRGIYDAMNKAVALARAEWVIFLNSGDSFFASDVLERVFLEGVPTSVDLIYGDACVVYPSGRTRLWRGEPPERLPYGMICSHQSIFVRRALLLELPFTIGKSASDYEFMFFAWLRGCRFHLLPLVLSMFAAGGVSDRKRVRSVRERWHIIKRAGLATNQLRLYYATQMLRAFAVEMMKGCLHAGRSKVRVKQPTGQTK